MRIAVLGATGRIGRKTVEVLTERGHDVAALNRAAGVDVYTGEGLEQALAGVGVVIDAVSVGTIDTAEVIDFFGTVATTVQRAAAAAGVRRIALVSIIGIDPFTTGHYAGKLAQETAYRRGPVPVRFLRAAQFHEFTEMMLDRTTSGDTAYVPETRTQLVDLRTVAEHLADYATAADAPDTIEVAGPHALDLAAAVSRLAARRGSPAHVTEVGDPSDPEQKLRAAGALLPGPDAFTGGPTFEEWLDRHYPA
ncbi:SDR family oxidoreductase [Nocardia takedensis]|uniref:SDR family oxidoreductase n=1 Tax=Nocardia takedensis TaxID=259390 RepID=UPI0002D330EC|nr:NAD(P)H-binding protein [Nocardia takedensis]